MANSKLTTIAAVVGLMAAAGGGYWYMNKADGAKPGATAATAGVSGAASATPAAAAAGSSTSGAPAAPAAGGAPAGAPPPSPAVEIAKPEIQKLQDDAQAVGTLRSRQNVMLRPEVPGRIAQLNFADGGRVRKGQTLVQLDDTLQRAEVRQANAQVSIARANYKRNQELVAQNFVAQRVLDESDANLQVAEAQMALACARFERMKIVAPFDATVGIRSVNLGDYVKDGADLVNLEDLGTMFVDFKIPERFASKLRVGQTVEISLEAFPSRLFKATINALDPQIDANGRAISVRASLPNNMGEAAPRPAGPGGPGGPGGAAGAGGTAGPGGPASQGGQAGAKPAAKPAGAAAAAGGPNIGGRPNPAARGGTGGKGGAAGANSGAGGELAVEALPNPCAGLNAQGRSGGSPGAGSGGGAQRGGTGGMTGMGAPSGAGAGSGRPQGTGGNTGAGGSAMAGAGMAGAGMAGAAGAGGGSRASGGSAGQGGRPGGPGAGGGAGGPQPLRPGMFAKVVAVFNVKDQAITVPEEAIVPQAGRQFVVKLFEQGKNEKGEPKWVTQRSEVKLGVRRAGKVEITEGVAVEDTIVVAGQQRLQRDGTAVRIIDVPRGPGGPGGAGGSGGAGGPAAPAASGAAAGTNSSGASPAGAPAPSGAPATAPTPPATPSSPAAPTAPRS